MNFLRNIFGTHPVLAANARRQAFEKLDAGQHDQAFSQDPTIGEGYYSKDHISWAHADPKEMEKRAQSHAKNYDYLYYPPESLERTNVYSNQGRPYQETTPVSASPVLMSDDEKASFWKNRKHRGKEIVHQKIDQPKNSKWSNAILDRPHGDIRFVRKGEGSDILKRHQTAYDDSSETMVGEKRLSLSADETVRWLSGDSVYLSQNTFKKIGKPDLQFYHDYDPDEESNYYKRNQEGHTVYQAEHNIPMITIHHGEAEPDWEKFHKKRQFQTFGPKSVLKFSSEFHDLDERNQQHALNTALDVVAHNGFNENRLKRDLDKSINAKSNLAGHKHPVYEIQDEPEDFKHPLGHKKNKFGEYELEQNRVPRLHTVGDEAFLKNYLPMRKGYNRWPAFDERLKNLDHTKVTYEARQPLANILTDKDSPYSDKEKKDLIEHHRKGFLGVSEFGKYEHFYEETGKGHVSDEERRKLFDAGQVHILNKHHKDMLPSLMPHEQDYLKEWAINKGVIERPQFSKPKPDYKEVGRMLESHGHAKHTQMHRFLSDKKTIPPQYQVKKEFFA